jgi:acyl-CoA synthetase (AMP-forming)/AMP-acid ligase II
MTPSNAPSNTGSGNGPSTSPCRPAVLDALNQALDRDGSETEDNPWHGLWYEFLRDRALPAIIADGAITPAASLWTGARLWTEAFRSAGLKAGDRLVVALDPSPVFVQVLVAGLWESLSVALLPPDGQPEEALSALDARAAVSGNDHRHGWTPDGCSGPCATPESLRPTAAPRTPDVRFLLQTSGTTGLARWIALSDRNVLSVLASHLPHLRLREARVLSVLPWSHAFGLVLDLLPALLAGAEIIRDPEGGRSPDRILSLRDTWGATHLNAVPLTIDRLREHPRGPRLLSALEGGIVGGAAVSGPLAEALSQTHLRVGYGQTEAAPGITLGARGEWAANYLGVPVGCEVDVTASGELRFRGPNACLGVWSDGRLDRADPDRWVYTGDLVEQNGDALYFRGRTDDAFKLPNGRLVQAGEWEARLKEQFDMLHDALVYTCKNVDVGVALCLAPDAAAEPPSVGAVRDCLRPLDSWVSDVRTLDLRDWQSLPKGEVDRQAMTEALATRHVVSSSP